jgi:hypothetical protein
MIWSEVEEKYGKEIADKIKKNRMLRGITITITKNGEPDIPNIDIELAYKDVMGLPMHPMEWD